MRIIEIISEIGNQKMYVPGRLTSMLGRHLV